MQSTKLSAIIPIMDRFQSIATLAERDKVRDLDNALALLKVDYKLPFRRRLKSMRVFNGVTRYALESDYDELSYIDPNTKQEIVDRTRFKFQSFDQFLQDIDYRNDWCEFYEDGEVTLGCRKNNAGPSRQIDNCESTTGFTNLNDVTALATDNVTYYEGNGSLKVTIVNSANSGAVTKTLSSTFTNSRIRNNYPFYAVYIPSGVAVPTSFTLQFGIDSSNYFYQVVTTQFHGGAFRAGSWNIVAFDIDAASTQGTVPTTGTWGFYAVVFTGAASGTYFLDSIYLREWTLLDLWYYSKNMVQLISGTYQAGFIDTNDSYATDTALIGPIEWVYVVAYAAMLYGLGDKADNDLYTKVEKWLAVAGNKLMSRFKSVTPQITNSYWNFRTDFQHRNSSPRNLSDRVLNSDNF